MCNNVVRFPREARVHEDMTRDQVLRACRIFAATHGCTVDQRVKVEEAAKKFLNLGLLCSHEVIERCKGIALELANPREVNA